ncbi:hypothetical protein ABHA39_05600 [Clostridium paraputrificum]|uniref:hypothetical protein n=1 Tax=Clostridium paraputrificum TaxID=29363 RepID=UPI00232E5C8E|nr:hypothetical protein [Clostridium paraputrificum]MDB2071290.1 hypothetical protein [Clostridium paraputrificum]MDB2080712.1 hypothetical protein [Clostridium paraputrificum]
MKSFNNLHIGQILYCKNGEEVEIVRIGEYSIIVEYKNKYYVRDISVIGKKLFFDKQVVKEHYLNTNLMTEDKYYESLGSEELDINDVELFDLLEDPCVRMHIMDRIRFGNRYY